MGKCLMCGRLVDHAGPAHFCEPLQDRVTRLEDLVSTLNAQVNEMRASILLNSNLPRKR